MNAVSHEIGSGVGAGDGVAVTVTVGVGFGAAASTGAAGAPQPASSIARHAASPAVLASDPHELIVTTYRASACPESIAALERIDDGVDAV